MHCDITGNPILCILQFYPFGAAENDSIIGPTLDGFSPAITLAEDFIFFGKTYRKLYVSNC